MPRISIFMSSYNYAKYLALAIESVLNQYLQTLSFSYR